MNEKIAVGNSMYSDNQDIYYVANTILKNMLKTRKKTEVTYRPYKRTEAVKFNDILSWQTINFGAVHPEAKDGDAAYADFHILCSADEEIYLNVSSNVTVIYNGETIFTSRAESDCGEKMEHLPISVKKNGTNSVRIYCQKYAGKFSCRFLLSVKRYPYMWANDYLFYARAVLPNENTVYEEGVAFPELIENAEVYDIPYIEQQPEVEEGVFNFDTSDAIYYIYTESVKDGVIDVSGNILYGFLNGKQYESTGVVRVKKGDRLLLCVKTDETGVGAVLQGENYGLPWVSSERIQGTKAVYIGPFKTEQADACRYMDEKERVYPDEAGKKLFWKFNDGSDLRIYLDSVFYGQWFYALMVGFYGIRSIGKSFKNEKSTEYFCDNMNFMAQYFEYIRYEIERYGMSSFMPRIGKTDVLDNTGTMGMNFIDAYFDTHNEKLLSVIEFIGKCIETTVPRFEDGTFFRIKTMWADDLYMSCPFLVRMGKLTGDAVWYQKAISQIRGFKERLYMQDKHLFSHIYFVDKGCDSKVAWGRGNGWVMWTLSEILLYADGKADTLEIKQLFSEMASALKQYQSESGLWRQVIDCNEEESYPETSCTGMFMLALIRGVKNKWIDKSYLSCIKKAWDGLLKNSIDSEGNIYGVCMGSECSMDKRYYFAIPTIKNDDHGTGVILTAAAEYKNLMEITEMEEH